MSVSLCDLKHSSFYHKLLDFLLQREIIEKDIICNSRFAFWSCSPCFNILFVLFSSHCVLVVIPDKTLGNTMVSWFLSQSNTFHNPNLTNKTNIEQKISKVFTSKDLLSLSVTRNFSTISVIQFLLLRGMFSHCNHKIQVFIMMCICIFLESARHFCENVFSSYLYVKYLKKNLDDTD